MNSQTAKRARASSPPPTAQQHRRRTRPRTAHCFAAVGSRGTPPPRTARWQHQHMHARACMQIYHCPVRLPPRRACPAYLARGAAHARAPAVTGCVVCAAADTQRQESEFERFASFSRRYANATAACRPQRWMASALNALAFAPSVHHFEFLHASL